jgi:hypothetical protein
MEPAHSCIGLALDCGTLLKGAGVTIVAFTLFIGSIYLLLTAIFGRWMAFTVLMVCFSGWMIIQSSLWLFGFWSQGPVTPTNLGPKGAEPSWVVLEASPGTTSEAYPTFAEYPSEPWAPPDESDKEQAADIQTVGGAVTTFLANQLNEELDKASDDPTLIPPTQFTIDNLAFTADADTPLAVAQAHYNGGGPLWTVSLYKNSGSVPRYSYMFLGGSILLFLVFLPMLDRAEKKRKAFLTGGSAPAWYGPA